MARLVVEGYPLEVGLKENKSDLSLKMDSASKRGRKIMQEKCIGKSLKIERNVLNS